MSGETSVFAFNIHRFPLCRIAARVGSAILPICAGVPPICGGAAPICWGAPQIGAASQQIGGRAPQIGGIALQIGDAMAQNKKICRRMHFFVAKKYLVHI
jgi:hypothetical protein